VSAISIEEIREGIELLPDGKRKLALDAWLDPGVTGRFAGRILAVDERIADRAGRMGARCRSGGHTPDLTDTLIAATAEVHGLTIATLNRKDFARLGARMVSF